MKRILSLTIAGLLTLSMAASAATSAANTNKVSPTLQVSATVQDAVSLTLSTGNTSSISHCSVAAGSDYTMAFGTVDALASNAGNCNKFAPATPGTTAAVYWSDYTLTPTWSSQATQANPTVTAYVSTNFTATTGLTVVRDTANSSTAPTGVGSFTALSTLTTGDTIATAAANNTPITRFIGLQVAPTATTGMGTQQTATVTFTLTVQ
jgi:hypothetical protein